MRLECAFLLLSVLELQFLEGEPARAYRWTGQTLHNWTHASLLCTVALAWRVERALVRFPGTREGSLHVLVTLSGSLSEQIILGIDEWPEGVRNKVGSLLLPRKQLLMLEQLPLVIQRREVPGGRLHILPVQVEVTVLVEDAGAELEHWLCGESRVPWRNG